MKIAVVSPKVPSNVKNLINLDEYIIYAVDQAVEELVKQNIKIDLAIGDFDSLTKKDLLEGLKVVELDEVKDVSDTKYAIEKAYSITDEVILVGGIKGNRVDHLVANILLFSLFPKLTILDDTNILYIKSKGSYIIYKDNYEYLSLFPIIDSIISIKGVEYVLKEKDLQAFNALGLSNRIIDEFADLEVIEGKILIIQSK